MVIDIFFSLDKNEIEKSNSMNDLSYSITFFVNDYEVSQLEIGISTIAPILS